MTPALLTLALKPVSEASLSFASVAFTPPAAVTGFFACKHPYLLGTDQMPSSTTQLTTSVGLSVARVIFSWHQTFKVSS